MPRLLTQRSTESGRDSARRHDELSRLAHDAALGSEPAQRTLLNALTPQLLRVVRRVLGPGHPDLEDVTYEAAYAVLEALPRFRGEGTVRHYACRVAALTAMNVQRRDMATKRARQRDAADPEAFASEIPMPDHDAESNSLVPLVRDLVFTLPDSLAEALSLHVVLGYTVAEIAESSGVPHETVRSRLRLAKRSLRKRALGHPALREVMEAES